MWGALVKRYFRAVRRTFSGSPRLDVALATGLFAGKLFELVSGAHASGGAVAYVLAPLWTLPLAWRSRNPLAVALIVAGTGLADVILIGYHHSVVGIAALVLIVYSLAAHAASAARMLAGLAAMGVAVGAYDIAWSGVQRSGSLGSDVLGNLPVFAVPFLAGLAMRQQRLRAQAMGRLAEQLEREREERARAAVAEERMRIARELHDEVAHAMSVIAVQADAAEGALAQDPALVRSPLVAIRDTARGALGDMRRVLGALRGDEPGELTPDPGLARVSGLLGQARAGGLEVELRTEGEPVPLAPALDLAAYRVVQEGLTNARKHAAARRVEVVIRYTAGQIDVEVSDDGDGSGGGGGAGRGLAGLRERVALLGGEFVAGPRARGFTLRVTLPLA